MNRFLSGEEAVKSLANNPLNESSAIPQTVQAFLANHNTLSLATVGSNGAPQVADVYYVSAGMLNLHFISPATSRHANNVLDNPRVAGTVHSDSFQWRDIKGVQMEGDCTQVTGPDLVSAYAHYLTKFPFVVTDPTLVGAFKKMKMYRIAVRWVRWIDNSETLGHNEEYPIS